MTGPAKTGAMIYASNIDALSEFYMQCCGMSLVYETQELKVLNNNGAQLIVHQSPVKVTFSSTPEDRISAIKLFFTVEDIERFKVKALELGGNIRSEVWHGPNFDVSNAVDCEGNLFHIRWPRS